jgi:hypothetical protein
MEQAGNLPNAEYRRFEGAREYEAVIDGMIPRTLRAIRVFENVLPRSWNSPARHEALRQFLLASRINRLLIVVHDAGPVERECPRMVELVQQFGTAVRIHQTLTPAKGVYDPFVLFDGNHYVHRFHYRFLRAAQGTNDVAGTQLLLNRFEEIWEASTLAVTGGSTGL